MSSLEARSQPIIERLCGGEGLISELDRDNRETLARWACKSAYALDAANPGARKVPPWHSRTLAPDKDHIPASVIVLAAHSPFQVAAELMEVNHWGILAPPGVQRRNLRRDARRSYKIAMQLGRLVLLVSYWPGNRCRFILEDGLHEVIRAPAIGEGFEGVRVKVDFADAQHFLYHFGAGLGIAQSTAL
jgi:hypothetical protein